jgi:hypothetical protein
VVGQLQRRADAQPFRRSALLEARFIDHRCGAKSTDLIEGTLVIDNLTGGRSTRRRSAASAGPEERDNESVVVKASYFLTRPGFGSHTIVAGYDGFNDKIAADNHQSGSGYRIIGTTSVVRDGVVYPVWNAAGSSTLIRWNPVFNPTKGSNFRAHALFLNDHWRVGNHLTLNLGMRYDRNDGVNSAGVKDVEDSKFSPRVGMAYDPRVTASDLNASYATYVSSLVNGIANVGSNAGGAATFDFQYLGPAINQDVNAPTLVTTHEALRILFDWFNANGGTNRPNVGAALPGVNRRVSEDLASPSADEIAGGVSKRLGDRGLLRVDALYRKFSDFYATRVDQSTGRVTNDLGQVFDMIITENTNDVERQYAGLNVYTSWRPTTRLSIGAGYTLSRTWGSIDGETSNSGPVTVTPKQYPEYREGRWNYPVGDLSIDQRHKLRILGTYTMAFSSQRGPHAGRDSVRQLRHAAARRAISRSRRMCHPTSATGARQARSSTSSRPVTPIALTSRRVPISRRRTTTASRVPAASSCS